MLKSRAVRYVALIASAVASAACGDFTGPTSPNVTSPSPMLAPPTSAADLTFTRWILISGVWVLVDESAEK